MNCQETSHLLDAIAPEALTPMQREAIDRHLASCASCREDWANWREIAALPVPATPATLRLRLRAVLPARLAVPARRAFRPYVVGGVLLVGAALAAAIALQFTRRDQEPAAMVVARASATSAPEAADAAPPAPAAPAAQPSTSTTTTAGDAKSTAVRNPPLDPHRIVVVKRPETAADAPAIAFVGRCQEAVASELRLLGGLDVVTDAAVHAMVPMQEITGLPERDRKLARGLGAGKVLTITTEHGCHFSLFDSQTGKLIPRAAGGGVDPQGDRLESFAMGMAQMFHYRTLTDGMTDVAAARAVMLNAALGDRERLAGIMEIYSNQSGRRKAMPELFDSSVVAAMVQMGTRSADARVRQAIVSIARTFIIDDPSLGQALVRWLGNDPDQSVRYQVAFALHYYIDQPAVRTALQRAATEDPQREPEFCGNFTVREAAQRAAIADQDFRAWARSTLFDDSLPPRSRLLQVASRSPDGRFAMLSRADADRDAARVVFDLGRSAQDPCVRSIAWNILWNAPADEAFLPTLLGDLASHPNEEVRATAAHALQQHVGNAQVRQAFERALEDPAMDVRRAATNAIEDAQRAGN